MRLRLLVLASVVALVLAPSAAAWPDPPRLERGPHAGLAPPAPVFDPLKSFKIELIGF